MSSTVQSAYSVSHAVKREVLALQEPTKKKCYCWPCCRKKKSPTHERAFTQHELDYMRILRVEAAKEKVLGLEEKK